MSTLSEARLHCSRPLCHGVTGGAPSNSARVSRFSLASAQKPENPAPAGHTRTAMQTKAHFCGKNRQAAVGRSLFVSNKQDGCKRLPATPPIWAEWEGAKILELRARTICSSYVIPCTKYTTQHPCGAQRPPSEYPAVGILGVSTTNCAGYKASSNWFLVAWGCWKYMIYCFVRLLLCLKPQA